MRLLHTSDWHLGRSLLSAPLLEAQRDFLEWLAAVATAEAVDAIVVSGDVYDRAVPSVEAVRTLEDALVALARICPVVVVPGNHDSAARLGFGARLLENADVHLRATIADIDRPVLLTGADGDRVAVYGLPYLEPERAHGPLASAKSHAAVLTAAMDRVRADLDERRRSADAPVRAIVLAHAFVTGGEASDSERDISVGGIADAPVEVFAGVDYVALGHLHGPQTVADTGPIVRYSGSPLAYSFSEESHEKSVTLVELGADGVVVSALAAPVPRRLCTLIGDLDHLLMSDAHEDAAACWVRAIVTDPVRPDAAMDRLRERFPHALELLWEPHVDGVPLLPVDRRLDPATHAPIDIVLAFVEHVTGQEAPAGQAALAAAAIEQVRMHEVDQ